MFRQRIRRIGGMKMKETGPLRGDITERDGSSPAADEAHRAEEALHGVERSELEHAELVGRRHVAEEDPAAKKR
jgi:hypothetical protein